MRDPRPGRPIHFPFIDSQPMPVGTRDPDFRLSLECPGCHVTGWVKISSLRHGLRCPKCRCQFLVAPNGQVCSQDELPQVEFACPRCGQTGSIPTVLSIRRAECVTCKLPLVRGPDQKLHGVREAAEMRRIMSDRDAIGENRFNSPWRTYDGRLCWGPVVLVTAIILAALGGGGYLATILFDRSPVTLARRFVFACLTGNQRAAEAFLEDDAVQRTEFDRWRVRHFSSILDRHRPRGDRVSVSVSAAESVDTAKNFQVVITSPFLGKRKHEQRWYERDGRWWFDARGTIQQTDYSGLPAAVSPSSSHSAKATAKRGTAPGA
jgi:hypothetical protein